MTLKVNVTEDSDTRVWVMLNEQYENIMVEFVQRRDTTNTEDWVEACLQNEAPMFNPLATSFAPTASAVRGTEREVREWLDWCGSLSGWQQVHLFDGRPVSVKGRA